MLPRFLARWIAALLMPLMKYLMARKPDEWVAGKSRRLHALLARCGVEGDALSAVSDLVAIFEGPPELRSVARRFVLEADPRIFKAVLTGALSK